MNTKKGAECDGILSTFPYPACWQDDARMKVLLAPFRERNVNPENFDSKMKFWINLIEEYCLHKGAVQFCKQDLESAFTRDQHRPCCLDAVIAEMQRLKLIRLRIDYEYDPNNSWTGWAVNSFVRKPLSWGLHKILSTLGTRSDSDLALVEYIHLEVLRKFCKDLLAILQQPPYSGKLQHYEELKGRLAQSMNFTEECLQLCLYTLFCQRKIGLSYKEVEGGRQIHLVKIPAKHDENVSITEVDHAIHNLQMTQSSLLKQIEKIEVDIKDNDEKARQFVQENKRQLAKTYLRRKHLLEGNLEKKSCALHNIEALLLNVDEAQHSGAILDAYKIGSKALQTALDTSGLKFDNVDEIVLEVRDTMDTFKELQNTLANANIDDITEKENDELERELKEILKEKDEKKVVAATAPTSPERINVDDAEVLSMLEGLKIQQKTPTKEVISI